MSVKWYGRRVLLAVADATDEIVSELAFFVEGRAKTEAPVDTGFMRNAIYAITPQENRRRIAEIAALAAAERPLASPPRATDEHVAIVHGAAEYTIYQEMRRSFLYRALQEATHHAPAIIKEVGRRRFG